MAASDTRHDLTDHGNATDAWHAFERADLGGGAGALEAWAREWGRPAVTALLTFTGQSSDEEDYQDQIEGLSVSLGEIETHNDALLVLIDDLPAEPPARELAAFRSEARELVLGIAKHCETEA